MGLIVSASNPMAIYVFETIDITGAGRGALIDRLQTGWAPHLEDEFGIRMVGVWATAGSTASWPEANVLWEMDDWEQFGRAQAARFPLEENDPYGCELERHSLPLRAGGRHDLLIGADFSPTRAQIRAEDRAGSVVLRENVRSRPGAFHEYQAALASEYLPVATARGISLLGAYAHSLRPNLGMNLWSFRDWAHVCETMETLDTDPERAAWARRERELLDDSEAWLLAAPPAEALGT
ncbi:MAG: hypothetical protein P8R42_01095 [Candidatus Binatia bacterium]|nr:hypothetical protein [Candidatus Binatia bacterium]